MFNIAPIALSSTKCIFPTKSQVKEVEPQNFTCNPHMTRFKKQGSSQVTSPNFCEKITALMLFQKCRHYIPLDQKFNVESYVSETLEPLESHKFGSKSNKWAFLVKTLVKPTKLG